MSGRNWAEEYSPVLPAWARERVFLLGGGASLTSAVLESIRGRGRVMAINSAAKLVPWADALFFTDASWFGRNRDFVASWQGRIFTLSQMAKVAHPHRVHLIRARWADHMSSDPAWTRQGRSSGHTALNVCIQLGCRPIVLLGFDCRLIDGASHCHGENQAPADLYTDHFMPAWKGYAAECAGLGAVVVNCSQGSALDEFERRPLSEVLAEC